MNDIPSDIFSYIRRPSDPAHGHAVIKLLDGAPSRLRSDEPDAWRWHIHDSHGVRVPMVQEYDADRGTIMVLAHSYTGAMAWDSMTDCPVTYFPSGVFCVGLQTGTPEPETMEIDPLPT